MLLVLLADLGQVFVKSIKFIFAFSDISIWPGMVWRKGGRFALVRPIFRARSEENGGTHL